MTDHTPTPRCDAYEIVDGVRYTLQPRAGMPDWPAFCRLLERDLADMTADRDYWKSEMEKAQQCLANSSTWIPVGERLPKDLEMVIVFDPKYGGVQPGSYYGGSQPMFYEPGRDGDGLYHVTHWMPLPEAPK